MARDYYFQRRSKAVVSVVHYHQNDTTQGRQMAVCYHVSPATGPQLSEAKMKQTIVSKYGQLNPDIFATHNS